MVRVSKPADDAAPEVVPLGNGRYLVEHGSRTQIAYAVASARETWVFLDGRAYESLLVRDNVEDPAAVRVERSTLRRADTLSIDLRAGGGFLARFS